MPTIKTERLILRPLTLSDLNTAHEYAGDAEHTRYMVYLPNDTIQETEYFLQKVASEWEKETPRYYEFAITLDGRHIGAVSVYLSEDMKTGELGWIINKKHQGNGYVTEAAMAMLNFSRSTLKTDKIIACCDYRNAASRRVMQKIGLVLESDKGTRRYKGSDEEIQDLTYSMIVE